MLLILISLLATLPPSLAQVAPTWQRNPNIDAGQSKPINFGVLPADSKQANTSFDYFAQNFNKTDFAVFPRVFMGQLNFGFPSDASRSLVSIGYNITMGAITFTNFTFNVQVFGVEIYSMHTIYLAVSPIYDNIYHMEALYKSFSAADPVRDIAQGATRTQIVSFSNPQNFTTQSNFTSTEILLQTWILGYQFTPNANIKIDISSTITSTSTFDLTVTVSLDFSLEELAITAIMVNKTVLLQYSYTQYLDIFFTESTSGQDFVATSDTLTDFTTMYFFRNTLYGAIGNNIAIDPTFTFFYYNSSSQINSTTPSVGMNQRSRVCPGGNPFYFYENQTCIASCPDYYFTNTTFDFCKTCHYSCQNCSAPDDSNSCTQCDSAQFRQLVNASCSCSALFFDNNTLLCVACDSSCLTCSNELSTGCLTCNATLGRQLSNTSCICASGFYQNVTCIACTGNCLTCSFDTGTSTYTCLSCNTSANLQIDATSSACQCLSGTFLNNNACDSCSLGCLICTNSTFCTSCDTSNNFQLLSDACTCKTNTTLNGSICQPDFAICGDGFLSSGQLCDDSNTISGDGCSSTCQIQTSHTCINNATLSSSSLCYYSNSINMAINYVFKVPLENKVQLTVGVSAQNINQNQLKSYLQTQTAVSFQNSRRIRLMQVATISNQVASYSTDTSTLTVNFDYTSTVELPTIALQFSPSGSATSSSYFFDTPVVSSTLASPSNKLLTTFIEPSQITSLQIISYFYLVSIVFLWIFVVVTAFFNQTAIALETFLVLQVTYESLVQSGFIYQSWSGLIEYGKYTYGYNYPSIISTPPDSLTVINLSIPLANTLNLTAALFFVIVLILIIFLIYQTVKKGKQNEQDSEMERGSTAHMAQINQITTNRQVQEAQANSYQNKQKVVNFCLEMGLTLSFLTGKITIMSLIFALKQGNHFASSLLPGLTIIACTIATWIFYHKSYHLQYLQNLSYRRLLSNLQYEEQSQPQNNQQQQGQQRSCRANLSNILVKHHYLFLYLSLLLFSILNSTTSIASGLYILVLISTIGWALLVAINKHYLRVIHTVRIIVNCTVLSIFMVLMTVQSVNVNSPQQNSAPAIAGLVFIMAAIVFNSAVFVRIEYRRRRSQKPQKTKKSNKVQNKTKMNLQTEDPAFKQQLPQPQPHPYRQQPVPAFSRQKFQFPQTKPQQISNIAFKSKSPSEMSRSDQGPQTIKKKIGFDTNNQITKEKRRLEQLEQSAELMRFDATQKKKNRVDVNKVLDFQQL